MIYRNGLQAVVALALIGCSFLLNAEPSRPPKIDLDGGWIDGRHGITITVVGNQITAIFKEDFVCDPQDGSPKQTTTDDFRAQFSGEYITAGSELNGETTVCSYGSTNPCGHGLKKAKFTLKVSTDGQTLAGTYYNCNDKTDDPFTVTRDSCPDVKKQLDAAADKSPLDLFKTCEQLEAKLSQCKSVAAPYCAETSCFEESQVQIPQLSPAQAPGVLRFPGSIVASVLSLAPLPDVLTLYTVKREPVVMTRDICANTLFLMRKADDFMSASGMVPGHQSQQRAIGCLQDFCSSRGWRTTQ